MTRQWSKVKADLQRVLAPSIGARLDVHTTSYRHAHEEYGRAWFTWDGAEVYSFDDMKFWLRVHPLHPELKALGQDVDAAWERSWAIAEAEGQTSVTAFRASVDRFLGLDARAALSSGDPVVRGLAMLDRRVGADNHVDGARQRDPSLCLPVTRPPSKC
jgi:hypothetical protein